LLHVFELKIRKYQTTKIFIYMKWGNNE